jgi:hypothetical protein
MVVMEENWLGLMEIGEDDEWTGMGLKDESEL